MTIEQELEEVAIQGIEVLKRVLAQDEPSRSEIALARLAASSIGQYRGLLATRFARERSILGFASKLTENREELLGYVRAALPESSVSRLKMSEDGG